MFGAPLMDRLRADAVDRCATIVAEGTVVAYAAT